MEKEKNLEKIQLKENEIYVWIKYENKSKTIHIIKQKANSRKSIRIDEDENGNSTISTILMSKDKVTITGPVPSVNISLGNKSMKEMTLEQLNNLTVNELKNMYNFDKRRQRRNLK